MNMSYIKKKNTIKMKRQSENIHIFQEYIEQRLEEKNYKWEGGGLSTPEALIFKKTIQKNDGKTTSCPIISVGYIIAPLLNLSLRV